MIGRRCAEFRPRNPPPIGPDLFGSPHPRCGNLAQPSNSVFVYLLVCSPHSLPALPHPHSTEMKPQPPHAVDYLVVSQSTGAATEKLQELLILKTLTGFFGTDRTANLERFHFHRRCSQNRTASIFSISHFYFPLFPKKCSYLTALVASHVGWPPTTPHENPDDAVDPALSTAPPTVCQISQNPTKHHTL